MRRRQFLQALGAAAVWPAPAAVQPEASGWRTFEVRVRVDVRGVERASAPTRLWVPLPLARETNWQRLVRQTWRTTATESAIVRDPASDATILAATFADATTEPWLEATLEVTTRDVAVAIDRPAPRAPAGVAPGELARYLRPTALIPTDGIIRERAETITRGHRTELSRARAIYEWIVEHTFRDPAVQGCGLGDIRWMLETGNLGGKCADLNALFVGLARAAGLPSRDLYGLRVAPSARWPSLGRAGGDVTTAQHCRAEVFLRDFGWVPVDPADVRKVMLEEKPGASIAEPDITRVRDALFGQWEMNWIAFNDAHDLALPGSAGKPLPFFMYPQSETAGVRKDPLDPGQFQYSIAARER
jgi:transglutaminase-like putative cysteine protease